MGDSHCYCGQLDPSEPAGHLQCSECKKRFHFGCLDNPIVSPLHGDSFYTFWCRHCGPDSREDYERAKVSWLDALLLTLYNLQLSGASGGKCGYYRWKDHVCAFIDKHWVTLFGADRKKTNTWPGTIAGTLSANCPKHFTSGSAELGEAGWWKLTEMKPPVYNVDPPVRVHKGGRKSRGSLEVAPASEDSERYAMERPRRSRTQPFSLAAAIELKTRRFPDTEPTRRRSSKFASKSDTPSSSAEADAHDPASTASLSTETNVKCIKEENLDESVAAVSDVASPSVCVHSMSDKSVMKVHTESSVLLEYDAGQEKKTEEADAVMEQKASVDEFVVKVEHDLDDDDAAQLLIGIGGGSEGSDMEIDPGSFSPTASADFAQSLRQSPTMDDLMMYIHDKEEAISATPSTSQQQPNNSRNISRQSSQSHISVTSDLKNSTDLDLDPDSDLDLCPSEGAEDQEMSEEEDEEEEVDDESGKEEKEGVVVTRGEVTERGERGGEWRRGSRKRKMEEEKEEEEEEEEGSSNLRMMTPYDEKLMLKQLNRTMNAEPLSAGEAPLEPWEADRIKQTRNVLRRKLIVRQLKRDKGLPVFDLDATVAAMSQADRKEQQGPQGLGMPLKKRPQGWDRTLDRFLQTRKRGGNETQHRSFRTRLVGFEDDHLQPITSPYTTRVLKPFIWRNQETMPLKVKLMQEIITYPHRNDPAWRPPPQASLDYCYVRPQHIPAVNALCHTFFWPGIDLAECLQYPDFSCVVMYKKLVVAFAFLVPDVKYNEAYISFIFTHPEWRGAGIATFMLYHLIQTCQGKDVTLHVSATNPAMLMYNKFGFKAEELCLDFYDKYLPVESKECRHAFFMRLRR